MSPTFKVGTKVIVDVTDEGIVKPETAEERGFRFPYSEQELLAGMTPEKSHADETLTSPQHRLHPGA